MEEPNVGELVCTKCGNKTTAIDHGLVCPSGPADSLWVKPEPPPMTDQERIGICLTPPGEGEESVGQNRTFSLALPVLGKTDFAIMVNQRKLAPDQYMRDKSTGTFTLAVAAETLWQPCQYRSNNRRCKFVWFGPRKNKTIAKCRFCGRGQ